MNQPPTHKLTLYLLGFDDSIPISPDEYAAITEANRQIMFGLGLEEKFDLVLENYAELERDMLNLALEHTIFPGKIGALLDGARHLVNRRLANLLTTARLYLDHALGDISEICGKESAIYTDVKKATSTAYDSVLGYRVMESLRNVVQHELFPIRQVTFPCRRDDTFSPARSRNSFVASISIEALKQVSRFKVQLITELSDIADKNGFVDLMPLVRDYIECFGRIHIGLREATNGQLARAEVLILKYIDSAKEKFKGPISALVAVQSEEDGTFHSPVYLHDRLINRRNNLHKKNQGANYISRQYVSSIDYR